MKLVALSLAGFVPAPGGAWRTEAFAMGGMPGMPGSTLASSKKTGDKKTMAKDFSSMEDSLTGPPNCELTGATFTPDGTTMFVSIQHPASGRNPERTQRPGGGEQILQLARLPARRSAAFCYRGDP